MGTFIDGKDDLVLRRTGGGSNSAPEDVFFYIDGRVAGAAATAPIPGRKSSLWVYSKMPGEGAAPSTPAVPTNATAGALAQTDPTGGAKKWLVGIKASLLNGAVGTLFLYDRLAHSNNLSGTTTGAQANVLTPTRNTGGLNNQAWVEIYTIIGATSRTFTISYTNQAATSGRTSQAVEIGNANFREAQRIIPVTLNDADYGVQAIASLTLSASTGTAGSFGLTLAHMLAMVPLAGTSVPTSKNLLVSFPAPVEIETGACLALMFLAQTATVPSLWGDVEMVSAV